MKENLIKIAAIIDAKTLRERYILMAVIVALVYFIVNAVILGGLLDNKASLQSRLQGLNSANVSAQQQVEHLSVISNAQLQRQSNDYQAMLQRLEQLNEQLESATNGFVPAKIMPEVLEEILLSHQGLKLLALENIPAESMLANNGSKKSDETVELYRHGVKLQLQGSYSNALSYLKNLEALKWHFQWEKLIYQMDDYPKGKLMLEVFTYSSDKEWLGV